jgi:hypothetical protein
MQMSVNQLATLTGKDRRTIATRLSGVAFTEGPKAAHLYDSITALPLIYGADSDGRSLDDAKKEQALENAALSRARREEIQKTRIPLEIPSAIWDAALQAFGATLKAARGKVLDAKRINALLTSLRDVKLPLKW